MEELKLNLELNLIPFGRLIWVDLQLHQFYVACDLSGVGGLDLYNTEIIWNSEPLGLCKSLIV